MLFSDKIGKILKNVLPAPFTIAVILTFLTILIAFFISADSYNSKNFFEILSFWEKGLWDNNLMVFALQMMLMLVLGHSLALSKPISKIINNITIHCNNTANAAAIVTFTTLLVAFFNWGLGLIFGAIFARKVGEHASKNNIPLNYPLIGAAGYSGLMIWHGGISGSAPIKIAEQGHFLAEKIGTISQAETIFSVMNVTISLSLIVILPLFMFFLAKKTKSELVNIIEVEKIEKIKLDGAEKIDHSNFIAYIFGGIIITYCFYKAILLPDKMTLNFITPNFINLSLLGLCVILHKNFFQFIKSVDSAIKGASGILIQFPLYFGIMGIMKDTGMIELMSDLFISISNENTFPIFTFFSAGLVNIFVPSGGGQWAIQGPIIVEAAMKLGVSIPKSVMSLAYGDQITNMLQPFWALPLLGITGLKAKEILPYTLLLMLLGGVIFITGILIF
ncbi:MAG: short-chain fatty acid transporter [Flavobacteriales bacterium]|nr:short-chain fatty acid transporter [Flavobacteriales bacterium]